MSNPKITTLLYFASLRPKSETLYLKLERPLLLLCEEALRALRLIFSCLIESVFIYSALFINKQNPSPH